MGRGDNSGERFDKSTNYNSSYKKDVVAPSTPTPQPTVTPPVPTPPPPPPATPQNASSVVAGNAVNGSGQINVADYSAALAVNPELALKAKLGDKVPTVDANAAGTNINPNDPKYQMNTGALAQTAQTVNNVAQVGETAPKTAQTYTAQTTQQNVAQNGQMTAQQGQVSQNAQVTAPQLDMKGSATGVNADGSVNETGKALNDYAKQNISNIIDTSTPAGKALAQALGDGNYTDSKATLKGQLDILQGEFVDADGNPKIPAWAAGTARNVSKIAAFSGMTGTAATAAMSQAIMEASIPIAQQDAQFFQTLTMKNLDNKQQSIINKANVLAKFDLTNIDNKMAAAVENAKSFLQMDMANLDNRQQAELINTQNRVQSILEDAKAVNAQRLFTAQSQNDMNMFYDQLNTNIKQFNASQVNGMNQFNTDQVNGMKKFNADLENNREQFYKNMQYNIDVSNAKWRQTVTLTNAQMQFEAAATDVKNTLGISQEALNQLWDRSDALLDYAWKSAENEADRQATLLVAKTQANLQNKAADKYGIGQIAGSIAGSIFSPGGAGSNFLSKIFG